MVWTCVDDPPRFMDSIWQDGNILKFVPESFFDRKGGRGGIPLREGRFFYGYRRNEHFRAAQWLTEGMINWGNHKCRGGGRSLMLVALRIAILLGFRRIYLVGCDFYG